MIVVGVGASAGGLAAFESFFSGLPADSEPGMSFVLVQHLAPHHKSMLTEIICRYTCMEVMQVEDGMVVRKNCAYIIPPNSDMALFNGSLQLFEQPSPRGQRLPIDFFFRSLAEDQGDRSIGIVLSGTGSDGTLGIRAIKKQGGMVLAQTPSSTEHNGMPKSAIATGLVDYVLAPAEMAGQLIRYVASAFGRSLALSQVQPIGSDQTLRKVFILLRARTGHDFSGYKPNTIYRRIGRRIAMHQLESLDDYLKYMNQTPS
ncbi:MAG: two-component system CheB/CheR fusion protein, partial [Myxococcota bacterium]